MSKQSVPWRMRIVKVALLAIACTFLLCANTGCDVMLGGMAGQGVADALNDSEGHHRVTCPYCHGYAFCTDASRTTAHCGACNRDFAVAQ